ncbi:hypothetical protein E3Q23_00623 [Wallemia mellicola]|uniref:Cation-transporting ATPase n=1 Tax=Wallemia mellicola TaxID=1708541 RepID=A0A4T0PV86_9BASI|nr:hypothetical protein E3Q23_00623 [Wallemia mellicola]TIB93936.1 hypothetical protein E3Q19_00780 [Wallemia mellicola]TIC13557.1 hypothetical protein E3Q15_01956 [Wallemia mellicola]TIC14181.1 hypothetical protein E3Q14_00937 [Wallemia mellicola]TIC30650.1 hypothetical protein E3Q11_00906 [Wallemia mellicola]
MTHKISSQSISSISLHNSLPLFFRIYFIWFGFYPFLINAYYFEYDKYLQSEEYTFMACLFVFGGQALSWLGGRWGMGWRTLTECTNARSLQTASLVRVNPIEHRGEAELVKLDNKAGVYSFIYQSDKYVFNGEEFTRLPFPCDTKPQLKSFKHSAGLSSGDVDTLVEKYGKNIYNIPVPTFMSLFAEHAVAPFFVFQMFCVALWCMDEYFWYSLFTGFMLVVFECTVVWQRLRTLNEFRTMSITPYTMPVYRNGNWSDLISDELVPGDIVSIDRTGENLALPCDLLMLRGSAIVNEAMLSGESTPLLKESIEARGDEEVSDVDGNDRNLHVLFGGTKVLQTNPPSPEDVAAHDGLLTPDGKALAIVLKTGFGTSQGQLIRTMLFSSEKVSANNFESFLFIGFLLIFAIAASAYVWIKGNERGLKKSKLILDCILIITSVVPPELPMELSLAVNASLVALSKFAIFCTEPFRIPFAGRVDVCCFDKTGTITGEDLVVEGVAGIASNPRDLMPLQVTPKETTLTLASSHALVLLDEGDVVGDPMEKTTLEALDWKLGKGDTVAPANKTSKHKHIINIRRKFQFSSALKRMSTVSNIVDGQGQKRTFVSVKGAPETIKNMLKDLPEGYEETYKWFTRKGSRVLALAWKDIKANNTESNNRQIPNLHRNDVESDLHFAGFLVFHCPLKPDAVATLKMLNDSSHRCIMITGDNPLTALHVANDVEIVDRDALILDVAEDAKDETDLVFRSVDEKTIIPIDPTKPIDKTILRDHDICMTGAALRQIEKNTENWHALIQHTWVYARVSPTQKETILTTFKTLGYTTLMAGDGTNDVGALKQARIGVALLQGTEDDLRKIAEHAKIERFKKVYEQQLKFSQRFNQPPPPVPKAIAHLYPDMVEAQRTAAAQHSVSRQTQTQPQQFNMSAITEKMADMEDDNEPPQIKLGDASCAAPFTSKLSNVSAIANIIRQGRCTLVATTQMYKILALNCLITAYTLSVQYLDGIKAGDYQLTISGMLMSVCFLCISKAKPIEKLSKERPLTNIFNFYILLSVLLQFAIHIFFMVYITDLSNTLEDRGPIDLDAEFKPSLLNTAIYLLGLSQQVSTFAINYQGRPFRESLRENPPLMYGLMGASAVSFCGATDFLPELNRWLQIVEMSYGFQFKLCGSMILDFVLCYAVEIGCKNLFANLNPPELVTRGSERREKRRENKKLE